MESWLYYARIACDLPEKPLPYHFLECIYSVVPFLGVPREHHYVLVPTDLRSVYWNVQGLQLHAQLSGYIDGILRSSIAANLGVIMTAEAFPSLLPGPISKLVLAVLRHRFDDAAAVSLLQRLFAAFLPIIDSTGLELHSSPHNLPGQTAVQMQNGENTPLVC